MSIVIKEDILSIKKHASCNVNINLRFFPDPNNPPDATIQSGTTAVVLTRQKGNIETTVRSIGPIYAIGLLVSQKTSLGQMGEIETVFIDRLASTVQISSTENIVLFGL